MAGLGDSAVKKFLLGEGSPVAQHQEMHTVRTNCLGAIHKSGHLPVILGLHDKIQSEATDTALAAQITQELKISPEPFEIAITPQFGVGVCFGRVHRNPDRANVAFQTELIPGAAVEEHTVRVQLQPWPLGGCRCGGKPRKYLAKMPAAEGVATSGYLYCLGTFQQRCHAVLVKSVKFSGIGLRLLDQFGPT